jgi:hypothetical protein
VLRRFLNNITYVAEQMSGAAATFEKKKSAMWGPGAIRPQPSSTSASGTRPAAHGAEQQSSTVSQPLSNGQPKAGASHGQVPHAGPSQNPGEAQGAKGDGSGATAVLFMIELQNTQVCRA